MSDRMPHPPQRSDDQTTAIAPEGAVAGQSTGRDAWRPRPLDVGLVVLGALTAAVYGLFFLRVYPLLGHVGSAAEQIPALAPGKGAALGLAVGWVLLFVFYVAAYRLCRRGGGPRTAAVIVGGSIVFGLLLLFTYPFSSTDLFDYVARSHFVVDVGGNPFVTPPGAVADFPYMRYVTSVGTASPYGPLWQNPADLIARLVGSGLVRNLVALKLLVLACFWCGAPLIYRSLRRWRPEHALPGTLLYAWNPAALIEFGANGHNDAMQVLCLVLAASFLVARQPAAGTLAVVAAALVKFSPLLLLPLFFIAMWKLPVDGRRRLQQWAGFIAGAMALTVLLYLPFGLGTIRTNLALVASHGDLRANSLIWALADPLATVTGWSADRAAQRLSLAAYGIVVAVLLYHCVRLVRSRAREDLGAEVLRRSFLVLLTLVALALSWFWPWYVLWLLALAPFVRRVGAPMIIAFTAGAFAVNWTTAYYGLFLSGGFPYVMMSVVFGPLFFTAVALAAMRLRAGGGGLAAVTRH
ncbi:MAG: hypothetical protein JF886_08985 [Candidatus Dormibacteraeota bacterium]|uniref:DUF2029 domain-containing protein n=1 Tax=Candidatus Aeolococcus gillhamiae TaxID=3127015 RepID=A0A934K2G1_9BACT|nr:hypothetical protein [Candidatus Dormibacteraeota bacterium]